MEKQEDELDWLRQSSLEIPVLKQLVRNRKAERENKQRVDVKRNVPNAASIIPSKESRSRRSSTVLYAITNKHCPASHLTRQLSTTVQYANDQISS
jgi:hypothetical protein